MKIAASRPFREYACWLLIAGCFVLFAWLSWRTWPDVLVDFGHELYIPWRMSQGEALYDDIPFTMGPLSQSVNALLFRVFGVSLGTLIWANLTILALIVVLLYWLFRRPGTPASATAVVVFFLAVFAFAQYAVIGNYNYVCPYRHEVTHGLALGLAELVCLVRYADTRRLAWLVPAGLCLGLAALTKAELFAPALAAALVGVAVVSLKVPPVDAAAPRARTAVFAVRSTLLLVGAAAIPIAVTLTAFATTRGWPQAVRATLGWWKYALDPKLTVEANFFRSLAGWDNPWANLAEMLLQTLTVLAALIVGYLVDRIFGSRGRWRLRALEAGTITAVAAILLVHPQTWAELASALPLLLAVLIAASLFRIFLNRASGRESIPLLLVAVYSLCLLPKILLRVSWSHYGFALAMPGTLLLVHAAIHSVPTWLREQGHSGSCFRGMAASLLAICAMVQAFTWMRIDHAKTLALGEGGDRFFADAANDARADPTKNTLEFLRKTMAADDTLVVIPEGATLNYLLRASNPTGYLMFNPWEFDAHGGERVFYEALSRSPPTYVVVVAADMSEHGSTEFGTPSFGAGIRAFIDDHYEVVDTQAALAPDGRPMFESTTYCRRRSPE